MDSNGNPYGPTRYAEIVKERYYIAKHGNISYIDSGRMTPTERKYIMDYIVEDFRAQQNIINQQLSKQKS